jgi:hypothetical protein
MRSVAPLWIPRSLYEVLPYVYMAMGAAALTVAFIGGRDPHGLLMLLGGLSLTAGLVLWMRRRGFRKSQADYDSSALDD